MGVIGRLFCWHPQIIEDKNPPQEIEFDDDEFGTGDKEICAGEISCFIGVEEFWTDEAWLLGSGVDNIALIHQPSVVVEPTKFDCNDCDCDVDDDNDEEDDERLKWYGRPLLNIPWI